MLADRLLKVATEMDEIIRVISPQWVRLAHLRRESQMIMGQLSGENDEGI